MAKEMEEMVVVQSKVNENGVRIFVRSLPEGSKVYAQIGTAPADEIIILDETECHTLILLDNSLSITEQNREKIQEILRQYFQTKQAKEAVSLAVFGENIQYLTEKEQNGEALVQALEKIEYQNQDSFLIDTLYKELTGLEESVGYERVILITDGVDNKTIGYTREELQKLLEERSYPVYALGCVYKENEQELENLFALSRLTDGRHYLLDDYESYDEIVNGLNDEITTIDIQVASEYRDGSERSLLLSVEQESESQEVKKQVTMPFGERVEENPVQEIPEEAEESIDVIEEVENEEVELSDIELLTAPEEETETETEALAQIPKAVKIGAIIGGFVLGVACITAVIVIFIKKKKKSTIKVPLQKEDKDEGTVIMDDVSWPFPSGDNDENLTMMLGQGCEEGTMCLEDEETGYLVENHSRYLLILRDRKDPVKEFRYPLKDSVTVGRVAKKGADIILDYDTTVSGVHCRISVERDEFYVEDLNSSNKTYLDGIQVEGRRTLLSGSILKLGKLEMMVEIQQQ